MSRSPIRTYYIAARSAAGAQRSTVHAPDGSLARPVQRLLRVLLYDLTSTYFESDPPLDEDDKRRHGYSRDHRFDCVQIVIALIVTPEGLPLAYEVLPGNTNDSKTLRAFLQKIEHQYGKAQRIWCMDRGVPTEEYSPRCAAASRRCSICAARRRDGSTARAILGEQALAQRPGRRESEAFTRG